MRASMPTPNKPSPPQTSAPSAPGERSQQLPEHTTVSTPRPALQRKSVSISSSKEELTPGKTPIQEDEQRTPDAKKANAGLAKSGMGGGRDGNARIPPETGDAARLHRLQEAMKLSYHQRAQVMAATQRSNANSGSLAGRRPSPITEESVAMANTISPTLDATFSSPLATGQTTSAASTESAESGKTLRGSVPATPNASVPLRTPSYPFPYVPGTPRIWSSSFHRPFTTLSPTVSAMNVHSDDSSGQQTTSEASTPAVSSVNFLPEGVTPLGEENARFPTPNLYDITLMLNMEPGLQAWWKTVSRVLREFYGAERASLAVPADAGELENVPWGQKATFGAFGPPEVAPVSAPSEIRPRKKEFKLAPQTPGAPLRNVYEEEHDRQSASTPVHIGRPKIMSRHSYAGYEREKTDIAATPTPSGVPERPGLLLRTKSYAPQALSRIDLDGTHLADNLPSITPKQSTPRITSLSFSDPEFSSTGSEKPSGPFTSVLPVLRALNYEDHALLETTGVNRIIERGKVITLTRDYSGDHSSRRKPSASQRSDLTIAVPAAVTATKAPAISNATKSQPNINRQQDKSRLAQDYLARSRVLSAYEEYEQYPSSPWAQSPAPSPAMQADPDANPFFASGSVDEESFSPHGNTPDYSQYGQVEAIGVDKASTIIHIPLMHPLLSQNLPRDLKDRFIGTTPGTQASGETSPQKKAPIAILSFLSPIVPFMPNLTNSLKFLAPHLATSFSNANQYTSAHRQASGILQRRMNAGLRTDSTSFGAESEGLQNLMEAEADTSVFSTSDSITSPSDYSGRSRTSPGGSLIGTPGLEPASQFFKSSVPGTPGHGSEMVDSYFDAKKRSLLPRTGSSGAISQLSLLKVADAPILEQRPKSRRSVVGEEEIDSPKLDKKSREDRSSSGSSKRLESSGSRTVKISSPIRPSIKSTTSEHHDKGERKRHTMLHSYGADFNSTFQSLLATTTPSRSETAPHTTEQGEDIYDMPPPSERLLRTIIDSLPVQIFTAAPGSGALTWVNSKFVAYRGKEPYEIIKDPWLAIHPSDRVPYMEQWQRSLSTGQPFAHKVRLQRFDNVFRWFFVRATPLKDKKQNIVHWAGTYMDIHEQHVAETNAARQQETALSEAKYRTLANSSPQIVFAVTKTHGVTFCNSQWPTYSGQTETQARALGFMDFVHTDDLVKCKLPTINEDGSATVNVPTTLPPEPIRRQSSLSSSDGSSETSKTITSPGANTPPRLPQAKLSQLASAGILKVSRDSDGRPSYSTEVRLRNKEGSYRWHLVRVLLSDPVHDDDEEEEETWYGTCTDINDHKILEQTLKDTMDAKTRFLSNMSHEIRTPLNGITGMVNFLIDSSLSQEQLEHVHIIRNSTEGLRGLINDILDLSKVEAGMITLQPEWMHIRSLIEEVNDLTAAMATGKGLELNYMIAEGVPSMVKGDRFRIRQVLLNVVGNAIKFTNEGEIFVNCEVYEDKDRSEDRICLLFQIMDTGSGFTEKEAEFLFKRFSQIDSSSTKAQSGTGLGLAISMQLVELHGGKMMASSVPGKGSTFTFTLKFNLPSESDHPPLPANSGLVSAVSTPSMTPAVPRTPASYVPALTHVPSLQSHSSFSSDSSSFPSPIRVQHHESATSSGSSDPSIRANSLASVDSHRSSASSLSEVMFAKSQPISLELPAHLRGGRPISLDELDTGSAESINTVRRFDSNESITPMPDETTPIPPARSPLPPPMFSILVVCPLLHSRQATVKHIEMTIPKSSAHHITAPDSLDECKRMLGVIGTESQVLFTHVIVNLNNPEEIITITDAVLRSSSYSGTSLIILTDFQQRKDIEEQAKDYKHMAEDTGRLRWVFKPLKPSKFAVIFDPQKQRELSTDRSQDSAQAVVSNQKQVFDDLRSRLGNKDFRVLLVEDNKTNQMVLLKFLKKVEINVESVFDGLQCTDKVFSKPYGYYSIILCDLHMPNKDGYQTCKDIRKWERRNKFKHLPIIALSANVLGDVYSKCVEAGFNSYVTKPVDFKELSAVMTSFLDPADPSKPHEFMRRKRT
ncbi:hypothetical protein EJ08DRAFT_655839 [Tothia fuscella]|uniref:histidine kinase n=1 Tax=Tothia fuscella TaxID=1048955 RepID=A0A9P4U403_9PEZI|nr:hypothetical protein EJ08DRAFT_655839 [Tothia fuscella]